MFGLISKKKIAKIALEIYLRNDADKSSFEPGEQREKDFYFRCGNANALNSLCHRIGINLTEDYVIPAKNAELKGEKKDV